MTAEKDPMDRRSSDTPLKLCRNRCKSRSELMLPNASRSPVSEKWTIRPLAERDRPALLRLNAANAPAVWPLTDAELTALLAYAGHHLVAVDAGDNVFGYLLSFPNNSDYDDSEIQEFRQRLAEPFLYICQVVIAN